MNTLLSFLLYIKIHKPQTDLHAKVRKQTLTTYFVLVMTDSRVLNSGFLPFWEQTMDRWTATSSPFTSRNCNRI